MPTWCVSFHRSPVTLAGVSDEKEYPVRADDLEVTASGALVFRDARGVVLVVPPPSTGTFEGWVEPSEPWVRVNRDRWGSGWLRH
jgi:hypothetical protein